MNITDIVTSKEFGKNNAKIFGGTTMQKYI